MGFKFRLEDVLKELGETRNWLAVESKVRPATIHDLYDGKTKRVELPTIARILKAINLKAKEKKINKTYTLDDIILYED